MCTKCVPDGRRENGYRVLALYPAVTAPPLPQISGIVILGIGIWIQISLDKYVEVSPEFSDSVPYVFIASGGLIILLGTFACCCTVKTQPVLLYIYSFFLLLVFFIVLAAGISAYAHRQKIVEVFQDGLRNGLKEYDVDKDKKEAIDFIQSTLHCCGINGTTDWNSTPSARSPDSCCARWNEDNTCVVVYHNVIGIVLACMLAKNAKRAHYQQV
ncbi:Tetraspanin-6 [Amphibalanus amphitrite]|uniref:Tetraspanin n=1 Tax=Amphibalanus amphitrite TaxID=1232801 RepID=A0A6A4WQ51_AMPAM|nr:Tetraspanin-6 [Amphibalanus amphitrite]